MLVSELFVSSIKTLSRSTELAEVYPEDFPEGLLLAPVVENDEFLGFLPLEDLDLEAEMHQTVGECELETTEKTLHRQQHVFEVLSGFQETGLSALPVLNEDRKFEGLLRLDAVFSAFAGSYSFQTKGGILVLSIGHQSYSLSEISRLIESNQAKILSVLVEADPIHEENLLVHLKINQTDLSRVVATLERFEYQVLEVHHTSEFTSLDKERLDQLMKYLGI